MVHVLEQRKEKKKASASGTSEAPGRKCPLSRIRNVGIVAHIDAGKTTVSERILFYAGRVHRMGEVHDGTAAMDWMAQEQERGITITSAATSLFWRNHQVNLIDTPGHVDFTAEVERSLRVLDGVIGVFCGVAGVQPQSETVWRQADRYRVPRLAFVNKLDRMGARFTGVVEDLRTQLKAPVAVVQLPWGREEALRGVIDLVRMKALSFTGDQGADVVPGPIPEALAASAERARAVLVEAVAEKDEDVLRLFLEQPDVSPEDLIGGLRRATLSSALVPVLCGSALRNKGIQPLLDAVVDFLPSPLDVPPVHGHHPKTGEPVERPARDGEDLGALVFKMASDPYVGRLAYVRIYSGVLRRGQNVYNPRTRKRERILRLLRLHANQREEVEALGAGEIGGVVGLRHTTTGDTLCIENRPLLLERIVFPEPVISMAIEPRTAADRVSLDAALQSLAEEDPTFRRTTHSDTGQTLVSGMGELHLEIIRDRLLREFKVAANTGRPMVSYRETVEASARGAHVFQREIGGRVQFAAVELSLEPRERGAGNALEWACTHESIPPVFRTAVEEGVSDGLCTGVLGHYPMVDTAVTVVGGQFRSEDSTEVAFKMAAVLAVREGLQKAQPVLLEPIMALEVVTPEESMGDVLGDLNARRGQVREMRIIQNLHHIRADIPLVEIFGYATALRSLSRGRATYTMEPKTFEKVPAVEQEKLLNR